ncbi:MAG: anti-sigma factor [Chloroflexota bacterium]
MDHAEALEQIEIAAAEPEGLDRLIAGDTPEAAAVAGHLAGCTACAAELVAIGRTASLVREVVASEPDPALRDRTLAFVREVGRDRSPAGLVAGAPVAGAPVADALVADAQAPAPVLPAVAGPVDGPRPSNVIPLRRRSPVFALLGLAAALLLAGVIGFGAAGGFLLPDDPGQIAVLSDATLAMSRLATAPDARQVVMRTTPGGPSGTLVFSPSSGELVMVATGLAAVTADAEYQCWVEVDGQRRVLGELYPGGDVQAWTGIAQGLSNLPAGVVFGVTRTGGSGGDQMVLSGNL